MSNQRSIGQVIADASVPASVAAGGLALTIIGSVGPWVTSPLASTSGTSGDGKYLIILAFIGFYQLWRHGPAVGAAITALIILADGIYQAVHIHNAVARVTFNGVQLDHVGWGGVRSHRRRRGHARGVRAGGPVPVRQPRRRRHLS